MRQTRHGQVRARALRFEALETRALLATLPASFTEAPIATNLSAATAMEIAPGGDLWVLEQRGLVKRFVSGSTTADVVGDISTLGLDFLGERGLLGIAFDPAYATNKQVYLYYTATSPEIHNRVGRFTVHDTNAADYFFAGASQAPADAGSTGTPTQSIVVDLDALSLATNHNGGAIHFGLDDKLYIAVGDNANGSNAQTLTNRHGKMLRINSDGSIPDDNPFLATATGANRAIWALGLRNPFTFAFQPGTGRMFINDVGQNAWEEINEGVARANYGWPGIEGPDGTPPSGPGTYQAPLYAYEHGGGTFEGFAITGGAFYNPAVQQFPAEFANDYFFADFVNDWINVRDAATGEVTRFASGALGAVDLRVANDGALIYLARGTNQAMRVAFPTTFPWHNDEFREDVNDDGRVSIIDALLIINRLNSPNNNGPLPVPAGQIAPPPFVDVSPDNLVTTLDAVLVINMLNTPGGDGEGEGASSADGAWMALVADWWAEPFGKRSR